MAKTAAKRLRTTGLAYVRSAGVDAYLERVYRASPLDLVEIERCGVAGEFVTDLSRRMEVPSARVFSMLRIPKATATRKLSEGGVLDGRAGQAVLGMVKLLGIAQEIVRDSKAEAAVNFDAVRWLGQWIEHPQAALDGRKPADLLDTPTGVAIVARLLGAMRSGAYQ